MKTIAEFVIRYRYIFTGVFLALVIACAAMIPFVETNYDMTKYLDGEAPSVVSLDKMEEEFGSVGTAQLMVRNVSESDARAIQSDILEVSGVSAVVFDASDEGSYKDGNALYKIFLETGNYEVETDAVIDGIRTVLQDYDIAMNGGAVQSQYLRTGVSGDMLIKTAFEGDTVVVNLISFFAIFAIILATFRSLSVPVLLTVLIQGAIWVSSAINVLMGQPMFFVAFIVVMCIQMGATVDYAILMTDRYIAARHTMDKKAAIAAAFDASIITILTSGAILVVAAFVVGVISRVAIISTIGYLLSRGCLISVLFVVFALPQLLLLFDPVIRKTTLGGGKMLASPKRAGKRETCGPGEEKRGE